MKHLRVLTLAALAMLASSTLASAQEAYTTGDVRMRAGPGSRYPAVATIPEERQVYIHGCLSNWEWCDVSWRRYRGWVFSDNLEAIYRSRRVDFDEYRNYADIPFVSFGFGYWDRHYRDRPWFDQWDRWGDNRERPRHHEHDRYQEDSQPSGNDHHRMGDRNRAADDQNDQGGDNTMHRRHHTDQGQTDQNDRPGMRCGTADADPSCPDTSRGHRMQMEQQ